MIQARRTPIELMDDIYSLAYWLTCSEEKADELVSRTYLNLAPGCSETELFKTFRACYFDTIEDDNGIAHTIVPFSEEESPKIIQLRQEADIRLSVLLSAIAGLKHRAISKIIGKPLDTVRLWLLQGRKALVNSIMKNTASGMKTCIGMQ